MEHERGQRRDAAEEQDVEARVGFAETLATDGAGLDETWGVGEGAGALGGGGRALVGEAMAGAMMGDGRRRVWTTVLPRMASRAGSPTVVHRTRERFEELRALGEGGVGDVVLVRDHDIDRLVALKRLKSEQVEGEGLLRFADEVRTIGRLEHPNIVPVYDVGLDDAGRHFFLMKYVEGETLEELIERLRAGDAQAHASYTFSGRAEVFLQILRALQHAHSEGVIHRDIKPANVMLGPTGEVMVMDWGLARQQAADAGAGAARVPDDEAARETLDAAAARERLFVTRHGSLLGTPAYMSPEQALGEHDRVDARSDIFSLGVLFYELMSLRHPFEGHRSLFEMLSAVVNEREAPAWQARSPHQGPVPAEYGWFIRRAMAKAPEERFQSIEEMTQALQDVMDGRFHVQCPVTFVKRSSREFSRSVDRHPILAVLGLGLGLAAAIGGLVLLILAAMG